MAEDKLASKFGLSKLSAACLNKSVENVSSLLGKESGSGRRAEVDGQGWTAAHFACLNKRHGPSILELLSNNGFSLQALTNIGRSPLHEACRNGNADSARFILGHLGGKSEADLTAALELKDREGNTALHLACRGGHKEVVRALLDCGYERVVECNRLQRPSVCHLNADGATPIGLAITGSRLDTARLLFDSIPAGNPSATIKDLGTFCPHSRLIQSLRASECQPMDIFFLGDSGTGKSTLIKTLQAHSQSTLSAVYTLIPYVNHPADSHRVGVIPTTIDYPRRNHQCPMVFHDVTGHRNYAHEAILKCTEDPLKSLFLISVDIRDSEDTIKRKILYWLNFLSYVFSQYLVKKSLLERGNNPKLSVMVIGAFNDVMPRFSAPQVMLTTLCRVISNENQKLLSHFEWKGSYALNTRRAYSWKMIQLRSVFQEQCQQIHLSDDSQCEKVSLQSYLLAAVVLEHLDKTSSSVLTFEKVIECVESSDDISCKLLTSSDGSVDRSSIMSLCRSLKHFTHFTVYETSHPSPNLHKRFIIRNLHQLLTNIGTTIEDLPHTHGIISHSDLLTAFQGFNFPSGFIVEFMESFQICEGVTGDGLKHMRQKIRSSRRSLNSFRSHCASSRRSLNESTPAALKCSPIATTSPGLPIHSQTDSPIATASPGPFQTNSPIATTSPGPLVHSQTNSPIALGPPTHSQTTTHPGPPQRSLTEEHPKRPMNHRHNRTSSFPIDISFLRIEAKSPPFSNAIHHGSPSMSHLTTARVDRRHSSRRNRQKNVPYSFFPTLVPSQPPERWEVDYDKYTYGFAWSLSPENDRYYFPPRFVTVLLFRLLHAFAPYKTGHTHQHEKVCDLWDCGIAWQDSTGTRACVTIHDNRTIVLSMQCLQNQELECLKLRNQVISEITSQKNDLHPEIHMSDVLIPDDHKVEFPIYDPAEAPACFDKREIGSVVLTKRQSVVGCTKRKSHVNLQDLLFLEPLTLLPAALLEQLLNEHTQDDKLSDEFCLDFAKEILDRWKLLAQYFDLHASYIADVERGNLAENLAPYWAAHEMIHHLRDCVGQGKGVQTYRELREALLEVSVFSEEELSSLMNDCRSVETDEGEDIHSE